MGGRGVPFGVVRLFSGDKAVDFRRDEIGRILEAAGVAPSAVPPPAPVPSPAPSPIPTPPLAAAAPPPQETPPAAFLASPPSPPSRISTSELAVLLAETLGDSVVVSDERIERAIRILRESGPNALVLLAQAMTDPSLPPSLRLQLLQVAGDIEEKGLAGAVARLVADPSLRGELLDPAVRSRVARIALDLAGEEALPYLRAYLERAMQEGETSLTLVDIAERLDNPDALGKAAVRYLEETLSTGQRPAVQILVKRLAEWATRPAQRKHFESVARRVAKLPAPIRKALSQAMEESR